MNRKHLLLASTFFVAACGGGGGSDTSSTGDTGSGGGTTNSAPVVDAGDNVAADEATLVQLAADVSDADGDTLTYTWSQTSGTAGTFSDTTVEDPTFTTPSVDADEDLVLQLSVSDGLATTSDSVTISVINTTDDTVDVTQNWVLNTTSERSSNIFESSTSASGVLYDVQSVQAVTIDNVDYVEIQASGIPKYDVEITQDILDELDARPRQNNDFVSGSTTATLGSTVEFGEDIGYDSSNDNCNDTGGFGYWPPGPGCPTDQARTEYLPADPEPSDQACSTYLNTSGLFVNGASIFGWGDGASYNDEEIFYNLAAKMEIYDLDICGGHAADGEYHAHSYNNCIADLVGDDGSGHSPIIGYAADGYPVYGPWEDDGVLAISGWVTRDYGASADEGGCDTPGERTCVLVDEYDVSQGVTTASSPGPDIGEDVTTLSRNTISADNGVYYQDYYFAQREATGAQLDEHNGHDNNDGRGYHYHVTLEEISGEYASSFPGTIGPTLYGEVPDNGLQQCLGSGGGGGAGGGGGGG